MKTYLVSVDACGFYDEYEVTAKDFTSARRKAKRMALRDFCSSMKIRKEDIL